jgi:hypothetical protein
MGFTNKKRDARATNLASVHADQAENSVNTAHIFCILRQIDGHLHVPPKLQANKQVVYIFYHKLFEVPTGDTDFSSLIVQWFPETDNWTEKKRVLMGKSGFPSDNEPQRNLVMILGLCRSRSGL